MISCMYYFFRKKYCKLCVFDFPSLFPLKGFENFTDFETLRTFSVLARAFHESI